MPETAPPPVLLIVVGFLYGAGWGIFVLERRRCGSTPTKSSAVMRLRGPFAQQGKNLAHSIAGWNPARRSFLQSNKEPSWQNHRQTNRCLKRTG